MNRFVYSFATIGARYFLMPVYLRLRVEGLENVPAEGPLIIASNHLNDTDPGIICTRIKRRIAFMAKAELFKIPFLKQFLVAFGAFPVRRGEADIAVLRLANTLLAEGVAVCVFPEGTREGPEEQLAAGLPGAAIIALRNEVPVLPIAIRGSGRLGMPKLFLKPFFRPAHVTLTIGKPFVLPRPDRINAASTEEGTRRIMEEIAALLPEGHRGYYEYISHQGGEPAAP